MAHETSDLWAAWTRRRDDHAFEVLVRPELPHVLGFARRLGCTIPEAEDALQDALARLATVRDDTPAATGLRAWLCREVHTRARSRLRSERRRRTRESVVAVSPVQDRAYEMATHRDEVARFLAALPEHERVAVELRYLHDLDYREIALVLRMSEGTCRQRVHRALAALRQRFGNGAAALVAALPLLAVCNTTTLVKGALAKSAVASAKTGGGVIVAMSTKKTALVALAVATGVVGTLGVQMALGPGDGTTPSRSGSRLAAAELAARDREITGLRKQLAHAEERDPSPGTAPPRAPNSAPNTRSSVGDARSYVALGALWRAAIYQLADPGKRNAAWAEVRDALFGEDRNALLAALWTVTYTSHISNLERNGLRPQLETLVDTTDPETRLQAWQALAAAARIARVTGRGAGLDAVMVDKLRQHTAESPRETRAFMLLSLLKVSGYAVAGPTAQVVLDLLEDEAGISETFRGLGRAKRLSDPVVAKLLAYAGRDRKAAEQVNLVLRHTKEKSREVVEYLLRGAEAGIPGALWGLRGGGGLRPEDRAFAAGHLRRLFDARLEPLFRSEIVNTIGSMGDVPLGDTSSREWLTRLRDSEEKPGLRFAATVALRNLDRSRR